MNLIIPRMTNCPRYMKIFNQASNSPEWLDLLNNKLGTLLEEKIYSKLRDQFDFIRDYDMNQMQEVSQYIVTALEHDIELKLDLTEEDIKWLYVGYE